MHSLIFLGAMLLPGIKPIAQCPRPLLININLSNKIDRGVFKRTFYKCRRQYKKSPCLVKLVQPEKGAFHAICGEVQRGLANGLNVATEEAPDAAEEAAFEPNCSSEIFESYLTADWANYQNLPIVPKVEISFCESLNIAP